MGRTEADAAVDEILARAVAAALRARGFRRRRRTWRGDAPGVAQVVTGYGSRLNRRTDMMLTLEIGISYLGLGEPDPQRRSAADCGHWHRIGDLTDRGTDLWWRFDATDPAQVSAAAQGMRGVWDRFGEPFLDLSTDPSAYLAWLVASGHTSRHGFDLALALGQHDTATNLINADWRSCAPSTPARPPRPTRTRGRTCSACMPGPPRRCADSASPCPTSTATAPRAPSRPPGPPGTPDTHSPHGLT